MRMKKNILDEETKKLVCEQPLKDGFMRMGLNCHLKIH
jgi:hypothetical protein